MSGWPPLETLKAFVTYGVAAVVILAGMGAVILVDLPADKLAIVAGFISGASIFLFGQEIQTRTARQSQAATRQGAEHAAGNGIHPAESPEGSSR